VWFICLASAHFFAKKFFPSSDEADWNGEDGILLRVSSMGSEYWGCCCWSWAGAGADGSNPKVLATEPVWCCDDHEYPFQREAGRQAGGGSSSDDRDGDGDVIVAPFSFPFA